MPKQRPARLRRAAALIALLAFTGVGTYLGLSTHRASVDADVARINASARDLIERGRPREAALLLDEALRGRPDTALLLMRLGEAHLATGNTDPAVAAIRRAIELDPSLPLPPLMASIRRLSDGHYQAALEAVEGRDEPAARAIAGHALLRLGRPGEAVVALDSALAAGFDHDDVALDAARAVSAAASQGIPIDPEVRARAGAAAVGLAVAICDGEATLTRAASDREHTTWLVAHLMTEDRLHTATRLLAALVAEQGDLPVLLDLQGDLALARGDEESAREVWRRLAESEAPESRRALQKLVALDFEALVRVRVFGDPTDSTVIEAAEHLRTLRERFPEDRGGLLLAARLERAVGSEAGAIEALERAVAVAGDDVEVRVLWFDAVCAARRTSDIAAGTAWLTERHTADRPLSLTFLTIARRHHAVDALLRLSADAHTRWPADAEVTTLRAHALLVSGHALEALAVLDGLPEELRASTDATTVRGLALAEVGRTDEALTALGDRPETVMARARMLVQSDRPAEAEALLVAARDAGGLDEELALAGFRLALGHPVAVAEQLVALHDPDAEDARLLSLLGQAILHAGTRWPVAADPTTEESAREWTLERVLERLDALEAGHVGALLLRGLNALATGDAQTAVRRLRRVLVQDPARTAVLYPLAEAQRAAGDAEAARETLRRAIAERPEFTAARSRLAAGLLTDARRGLARGDRASAIPLLRELVEVSDESVAARRELARGLVADGQAEAGIAEARAALEDDPTDGLARMLLATGLARLGRTTAAREELERIIADAPETAAAWVLRASLRRAAGDPTAALEDCSKAGRLGYDGPELPLVRARALDDLGRYEESLGAAREAVDVESESAAARRALATALLRTGDRQAAARSFERLVGRVPDDADAAVNAAVLYLALHNTDDTADPDAVKDADRTLRRFAGRDARVTALRAQVLLEQGRAADAEALYREAGATDPRQYLNSSRLAEENDRLQAAIADLELAVAADAGGIAARVHLGVLLDRAGQPADAAAHYTMAVERAPDDVAAHNNLALVLVRMGDDLAKAGRHAERARELAPKSAAVRDTLGVVAEAAGELDAAIAHFRAALKLSDDGYADAHWNLGRLLTKGDPAAARRHLKRARELAPDASWAEEASGLLESLPAPR